MATQQPARGASAEFSDTTVSLATVEVLATRASATTPVTSSTLSASALARSNHGQDIPFLLQSTPSVLTTSDAGAGVGYTSLRVRGTDGTRINVTINDIPVNDAESHVVYWVNTPDFVSSLQDVQVQRGVGTSTNGAGAFGASVNMRTQRFSLTPYAEVGGSYGSFNTNRESVRVGTGLLRDHWALEARLSHIGSDGYRDRAFSKLWGYYAQAGYFNGGTSVRFITFGGKEDTYHAWDGISREMLTTDRTYNPNGEIKRDGEVVGFYSNQVDEYTQRHYQLIGDHKFNNQWQLNVGLHFTHGKGYYEEYKNRRTLKEYLLEDVVTATGTSGKSSLVRRKHVGSNFGGVVASLHYGNGPLRAVLGGAFNRYKNDHYGRVIWVENYTATLSPDHEYYRNVSHKTEGNIYLKGDYTIWQGLSAYLDLQYRHIGYTIEGNNDKWDWTASPEHLQVLNIDEKFDFFNPKVGLNWQINQAHRLYASMAVAHKEPTRNNYTDGPLVEHPRAERLIDWELGYQLKLNSFNAGVNLYYMRYKDQLVLNGRLNEIGEAMAENVPVSYRMGVELQAGYQFTSWLRWDVNATFSRNRINDYVGYLSAYDADTWDDLYTQTPVNVGNTTIAFSPSVMLGSLVALDWKGLSAQLQTQYVSRQYLDNFESHDDSIDPYTVTNLNVAYTFKLPAIRSLTVGLAVYNLFNAHYETNGYSQTCALYPGGDLNATPTIVSDPRYYPMAGTNVLGHITLKF